MSSDEEDEQDLDQMVLSKSFAKLYHEDDTLVEESTMDLLVLMPGEGTISLQSLSPERTILQILRDIELLSGFLEQYCTLLKDDGHTAHPNDALLSCANDTSSRDRAKIVLRLQIDSEMEHLFASVLSKNQPQIRDCLSSSNTCSFHFAALFLASQRGHLSTCQKVLDCGHSTNQVLSGRSTSGRTALHAAATGNHVQVAQLLIHRGCPPQALDENRCSAADIAQEFNADKVRQLLLTQCARKSGQFHQRAKSAGFVQGHGQTLRLFEMPMPGQFDPSMRFKSRNYCTKKSHIQQSTLSSRPVTCRSEKRDTVQLFCGTRHVDK